MRLAIPALALLLPLALPLRAGTDPEVGSAAGVEAERAYFAGELRAARPLLERQVEARPDDALAAYRLHYVLRALGAGPDRVAAARDAARTRLEARIARRADPVGLYYLGALLDDEAGDAHRARVDALIEANLPHPDPGWDAFALTRFLHLLDERERDVDERGAVLERILALGPAVWTRRPVLQDVAREVAAACAGRPERLARVEAAFRAAIAAEPGRAELPLARAAYLRDLDRTAEAAAAVAAARAAEPQAPADLARAAELFHALDDPEAARVVALELIGREPSARAWRALARAEQELERTHDALVSWRRVIALDPTDVAARIGVAHALESLGRPGEAERAFHAGLRRQAAASAAGRAWLLLSWAQFLERQGRLDEALSAVADAPPSLSMHRFRARASWRLGRHERALAESEAGLAAHPDDPSLLHWRSLAFRGRGREGDVRRALEANAAACAAAPELRAYRAVRVALLWDAGRDAEAIALQRELLDEQRVDLEGWLMLGRMLSAKPDGLADAAQVYRRALAHFPEDPRLWRRLMETLAILSQREQRLRS